MKILNLPDWKIEIIIRIDEACQLHGLVPKNNYAEKVLTKNLKSLVEMADHKPLPLRIKAIETILNQLKYLPLRMKTTARFKKECELHLKAFQQIDQKSHRAGRRSVDSDIADILLAVIEQSKITPHITKQESKIRQDLTEELFNFLCSQGSFWKWLEWRFGNVELPFYIPTLQRNNPSKRNNFKDQLKETLTKTKIAELKRVGILKSGYKKSIQSNVEHTRRMLFDSNKLDETTLGIISRKFLVVDNGGSLF